ncbi:hypothetical protein [Frankia sp. R82]|uniref:hypothetical protein n=1 Tax=Frankia sp. R82 TaxID=2950553 RepID=UPI002044CAAA|nr:hypothetical protein [Frankia sp. R82]MCM3882894.1 hypothetical protein [Frankia sp. R82]
MPAGPDQSGLEEFDVDAARTDADAPGGDGRPLLRPVDWDGSSSRVWDARHGNDVTNQLFAEQSEKWSEELLQRLRRERQEAEREARDRRPSEEDLSARRARESELDRLLRPDAGESGAGGSDGGDRGD